MSNMIDINLVNRRLVKPCTPTPENLKIYKLSFTDMFVAPRKVDVGVLLFYAPKEKQIKLEESLAKVLVQFYPLAGRFVMKDGYVDCSDQGAEFIEAKVPDVELASLVIERNLENLVDLFPRKNQQVDEEAFPILSIQITQLKCGGVVIGISVSHKIFDASSMATFVSAWSIASKGGNMGMISPILNSSTLLKNRNNGNPNSAIVFNVADTSSIAIMRFTFNKEAITRLKSKLRPREDGKRGWSRVRVVCAVIAKALIGVKRAKHGGIPRPWSIIQAVNIRDRTIPSLPMHSCGNLVLPSYLQCMETDENMGVQELNDLISDNIDKCIADCAHLLSLGEDGLNKLMVEPSINVFTALQSGEASLMWFTDWSKFGFYQTDFGWGNPVWASILLMPGENGAVLMENKEGNGIEAWVHLDKNDMALFEQDEEIRMLVA